MDWNIFLQVTLPLIAGIGWILLRQEKLFDKIEAIGNRLNRLEGEVEGMKGILQTVIAFLLGNKTGTGS